MVPGTMSGISNPRSTMSDMVPHTVSGMLDGRFDMLEWASGRGESRGPAVARLRVGNP